MTLIHTTAEKKSQVNRRQILKALAHGATATASLGLGSQLFAAGITSKLSQGEKHGTRTGHCLESLEQGLTLGLKAFISGQVSANEILQAKQTLIPQTHTALQTLFQKDYSELKIIQVNGWTLSRSEAHFYAALTQT